MSIRIKLMPGLMAVFLVVVPAYAQHYDNYYQQPYQYGPGNYPYQGYANQSAPTTQYYPNTNPMANLQYDHRDAEAILRGQMARSSDQAYAERQPQQAQMYDSYYGHRLHDEGQVQQVMQEARYISSVIKNRNGKAFVVIDKRNFQFYLYDQNGGLLRIGPVAIGKGKTHVGAFETPVGIFPIKSKVPVDDWIRPDWYFVEENEPIPARWEDRRVPGFFRYKMVYDGARYIHYAEATGGRLTHGCLGLDWHDAEAVFHTLSVGSYCIIIDNSFLTRLVKGEFPLPKPTTVASATKQEGSASNAPAAANQAGSTQRGQASVASQDNDPRELGNLW